LLCRARRSLSHNGWMRSAVLASSLLFLALAGCTAEESDPEPVCEGVATSCTTYLGEFSCGSQAGCYPTGGECSGVSTSCSSFFSPVECGGQPGCDWSSVTNSCSGFADSCFTQDFDFTCEGIEGCYWEPFLCNGVAELCSQQDSDVACGYQEGCTWVE